MLLLTLFLAAMPARALTTSPQAFRLEDASNGNVVLGAEHAELEHGEFRKTVLLLWGNLDIFGTVDEVVVLSGRVVFHDGSKLNKSLTVMGGSFESQPGSQVAAENVIAKVPGPAWQLLLTLGNAWRDNIGWMAKLCAGVVSAFVLWLLGLALFTLSPKLQAITVDSITPNWPKNLVLGLFGAVAAVGTFVILVISIVGWLVLPFYAILVLFAGLASYLAAALWTGHRLLPPAPGRRINPFGFLLGCLALQFFWAVPTLWALLPLLLVWTLAWGALFRSAGLLWK